MATSYLSGLSFRTGTTLPIDELFPALPAREGDIGFFLRRGLKHFCAQFEPIGAMCFAVVTDCLKKAGVDPDQLGAILVDAEQWKCTVEDETQILESLHAAGIAKIPIIGLGLQTCSGFTTALGIADRLLRTDRQRRPILVLLCGRAVPGASRIDTRRATILSDGVSACIVSNRVGALALLACIGHTDLATVRSGVAGEKAAISLVHGYGQIADIAKLLYETAGVSPPQIDALFCTNGNLMYATFAARAAGIDSARAYTENISAYGHLFSSDPLINVATCANANALRPGGKYLLVGWSPYVIGGAILSYENVGTAEAIT
jgi:3-oxoacyl-[acyl-carrier-protein] synthase III